MAETNFQIESNIFSTTTETDAGFYNSYKLYKRILPFSLANWTSGSDKLVATINANLNVIKLYSVLYISDYTMTSGKYIHQYYQKSTGKIYINESIGNYSTTVTGFVIIEYFK